MAGRSTESLDVFSGMDLDNAEAWFFATFELSCHNKGSHNWIQTLNRLIRKNDYLENIAGAKIPRDEVPHLDADALLVSRQSWTLEQLVAARRETVHMRHEPQCDRCPIVLLELNGDHFIVDGNTRLNRRILSEDPGPHDVVVISQK